MLLGKRTRETGLGCSCHTHYVIAQRYDGIGQRVTRVRKVAVAVTGSSVHVAGGLYVRVREFKMWFAHVDFAE